MPLYGEAGLIVTDSLATARRVIDKDGSTELLWHIPSTGDLYLGALNGYAAQGYYYIDSVGASWGPKG